MTYTATFHNAGPGDARNVVLYQQPESATFRSVEASQGTCERVIGMVRCRVGTVPAGASALMSPQLPPGQVFLAIFPPGVGFGPGRQLTILPAPAPRRRSARS